jgi:hypothetical protein
VQGYPLGRGTITGQLTVMGEGVNWLTDIGGVGTGVM